MILDEKISEGLYYKYSDRLYNFAFRFVSDEHTAQDIVHEAYSTPDFINASPNFS